MNGRDITKIVRNLMLYKNKVNGSDFNNNEYELVRYLTKHKEGLSLISLAEYLNVDKALVRKPKVIFIDEMNAKIVPLTAKNIIILLNNLAKDKTIISTNHYGEILRDARTINLS